MNQCAVQHKYKKDHAHHSVGDLHPLLESLVCDQCFETQETYRRQIQRTQQRCTMKPSCGFLSCSLAWPAVHTSSQRAADTLGTDHRLKKEESTSTQCSRGKEKTVQSMLIRAKSCPYLCFIRIPPDRAPVRPASQPRQKSTSLERNERHPQNRKHSHLIAPASSGSSNGVLDAA